MLKCGLCVDEMILLKSNGLVQPVVTNIVGNLASSMSTGARFVTNIVGNLGSSMSTGARFKSRVIH